MKSAKELCAMLITRAIKDLGEDEEDVVVDYLESIGVDVDLDMKPRDMCLALLEKTMVKDLGKKVPLTAYANSLIKPKEPENKAEKELERRREVRRKTRIDLEKKAGSLPGCVFAGENPLKKTLYNFQVDQELGIVPNDNGFQYSAAISLSRRLYDNIFLEYESPVVELLTAKGFRGYSRVTAPHEGPDDLVLVSPLVAALLNFDKREGGFLKLCVSLPEIKRVQFTFYGNDKELQENLKTIIEKVPYTINAFSYLSLGMVLTVELAAEGAGKDKEVQLRVDALFDSDDRPLFAGILPFAESEIPFDINPDI